MLSDIIPKTDSFHINNSKKWNFLLKPLIYNKSLSGGTLSIP